MKEGQKMGAFQDPAFSSAVLCRLLLRADRTFAVQRAIHLAVKSGTRVLDAGCGSGLLSFLAMAAGASEIVSVDRENIGLARALAAENGVDQKIHFIEADLQSLVLPNTSKRFDVLVAFVYTNHIIADEGRSTLVRSLRDRFGSDSCKTIPNKVRYSATACDWQGIDASTELRDLAAAIEDLEHRYSLKLRSLLEATSEELQLERARPRPYADYRWAPAWGAGGYRFERGQFRLLGQRTPVAEVCYDTDAPSELLPDEVTVKIDSPGILSAVMWIQELWFDDFLIWTAEHMSPLSAPVRVRPGEQLKAKLDTAWKRTNTLSITDSF